MTNAEYLAVSMLTMVAVLFVMLIFNAKKQALFAYFLNATLATLAYLVLVTLNVVEPSRLTSLGVGTTGLLYLIALPML